MAAGFEKLHTDARIFFFEVILFKIRNDIPVTVAATIMINPCTAYRYQRHQVFADFSCRMLLDFVELAPGDWVVQNGANSAVNTFSLFKTQPSKLFPRPT